MSPVRFDTQLGGGGGNFSYLVLDVNLKVSTALTCATLYCCLIILHVSFVFFTCASGFVCKNRLLELVCMLKSLPFFKVSYCVLRICCSPWLKNEKGGQFYTVYCSPLQRHDLPEGGRTWWHHGKSHSQCINTMEVRRLSEKSEWSSLAGIFVQRCNPFSLCLYCVSMVHLGIHSASGSLELLMHP